MLLITYGLIYSIELQTITYDYKTVTKSLYDD